MICMLSGCDFPYSMRFVNGGIIHGLIAVVLFGDVFGL